MANRKSEAWNEDDIAQLMRMYVSGASNAEIARALERTEGAVGARLSRLRKHRRLFTDASAEPASRQALSEG